MSDKDETCETEMILSDVFKFRKEHQSNFIAMHVNINSFRHKFAFLHDTISKNAIDYFAIAESKLDSSFTNSQFGIEGYTIHRQDMTCRSGGLFVYIRSDLPHRRLQIIECNENGIETICIEVTIGKSKTIIICVYKHPKVKNDYFKEKMGRMTDTALTYSPDIQFIGDMNCCPTKSDTIKDICDVYNLTNLVKSPTCFKGHTPTLLDNILVSNPRKYSGVLNCQCELSDVHNCIGVATKRFAPSYKPRRIEYRSYKKFSDEMFESDVETAPFHVAEIFDDIEDMAWFTSQLLNDVINDHAPIKTKVIKCNSVPYMNSQLRKTMYKRNMIRNKFRKYGKCHWEENRRMRNQLVSIRKKSIATYFSQNCQKRDKTFWNTVSPFMTDKQFRNGNNIILNEGGRIINDDREVADVFNDLFCNVASTIGFDDGISSTKEAIDKHKNTSQRVKNTG